MSVQVHFKLKSLNAKLGPIPASVSDSKTCPETCPLKGSGCYAELGPTSWHWKKVDSGQRGGNWEEFLEHIRKLPMNRLWRHNVAGDLVPDGEREGHVDGKALADLVLANLGKRGFTYSHHDLNKNRGKFIAANRAGFTINASMNNPNEAVEAKKQGDGVPLVSVVPLDFWEGDKRTRKVEDVEFVRCPAEVDVNVTCSSCGACAKPNRKSVIGFTVHGVKKKHANIIASG